MLETIRFFWVPSFFFFFQNELYLEHPILFSITDSCLASNREAFVLLYILNWQMDLIHEDRCAG